MKRHEALIALSREHHHALLLAQAVKRDASPQLKATLPATVEDRAAEVRRRFADELEPHFRAEEEVLLPVCDEAPGPLPELAARVRADHAALRALVGLLAQGGEDPAEVLDRFGHRMEQHVRLEEREWFEALQAELSEEALTRLAAALDAAHPPAPPPGPGPAPR